MTQEKLAEKAGFHINYIGRIERALWKIQKVEYVELSLQSKNIKMKSRNRMVKKLLLFFCLFISSVNAQESITKVHENAISKTDIRVVVFDFGGVIAQANTTKMADFLINSFNINKEELSCALRDMQSFVSTGGSEKQFWKQYATSKRITLPHNWFDQFATIIRESITEIPESLAIVRALQNQGYQTAMLSDVTQYQAEIIRKMGYYDLFNPVLLSYATGVKKPNPEAFKILLKKLELDASYVLFIDDRNENVEAAKELGIDSIQFTTPQKLTEELEKKGFDLSNTPKELQPHE